MGLGITIAVNGEVDADLMDATTVAVHERMGETTTYRLRYEVDISGGDLSTLVDKRIDPDSELSILVPIGNQTHCLVKGPVHGEQIHLEHGGAGSYVEVTGSDTSIKMDRETRLALWSDVPESQVVGSILKTYKYTPDVQATAAVYSEQKHKLGQRDSDLRFVRRLARRNGFLFWVTCDAKGAETAHFKRPPLEGEVAATLLINFADKTISTLDITWDVERPTSVIGQQLDLNTKGAIDGNVIATPQTILGKQSLQQITGDTRSIHLQAPVDDTGNLQARGEGALIEADWFIQATCQTSLESLGQLIRAHTVVDVQGAGSRHSGKYFVAAVNHTIDATVHKMDVTLLRNGWGG